MAKVVGRDGVVKIGANTVAEVVDFSLDETADVIDATNLGSQNMEYVAGDISGTGSINCHWDKADSTGQGAMTVGASVSMILQPEGDTSGDETRSFTAIITGVSSANARAAMVSQNFTFQVSGAITVGAVV